MSLASSITTTLYAYFVLLLCWQVVSMGLVDSEYERFIADIPEQCIQDISPRQVLRDKGVFVAIKRALLESTMKINDSHPLVLGAGQGTSGTRTLHDWCKLAFQDRRSNLHFSVFETLGIEHKRNSTIAFIDYMKHIYGPRRLQPRKVRSVAPLSITTETFQESLATHAHSAFGKVFNIAPSLGCILDSPWTAFFTELYYATCPHVRVVHTVRDPVDWARSRIEHHGKGSAASVCPKDSPYDPFSLTQCAHLPAMIQTQPISGECLSYQELGVVKLATEYRKYTRYIRNLIPEHLLLEVNLFMSRYHNSTINETAWTNNMFRLFELFVTGNAHSRL